MRLPSERPLRGSNQMNGRSREIAATMELVSEAEGIGLQGDELHEYVKEQLQERFPEVESLTIRVMASEIIKMRIKGMW